MNAERHRANTKDEDPTGLLNEGFRYRDLATGVFISRDPAGFVDGPNVYTYVKQNPWSAFDSEGLFWSAVVTAGFAAYDTYAVVTGSITKTEYAGRMALNGAALVADAATGGMGGGVALRLAANGSRAVKAGVAIAKAVDRGNTAYEAATGAVEMGQTIIDAAETGDGRCAMRAVAEMAGEQMVVSALGVRKKNAADLPSTPKKPTGRGNVGHAENFDKAREEAFENAGMTDPEKITFSKMDPETGTVVEFKGENGAKVAYDSPHKDMDASKGHDKPHVGWQSGGKQSTGGGARGNITYDGEAHPSRSDEKL